MMARQTLHIRLTGFAGTGCTSAAFRIFESSRPPQLRGRLIGTTRFENAHAARAKTRVRLSQLRHDKGFCLSVNTLIYDDLFMRGLDQDDKELLSVGLNIFLISAGITISDANILSATLFLWIIGAVDVAVGLPLVMAITISKRLGANKLSCVNNLRALAGFYAIDCWISRTSDRRG